MDQSLVFLLHVKGSNELSNDVAVKMTKHLNKSTYYIISNSEHNFQLEDPKQAASQIQNLYCIYNTEYD